MPPKCFNASYIGALRWLWSNIFYPLCGALLCPTDRNWDAALGIALGLTMMYGWYVGLHSFLSSLSLGNMNSLSGKSVLSLCRRTTNSIRVLANSTPSSTPLGHGLTRSLLGAQRVCHSATNNKTSSIRTKKRGYDITRNPQLNKVMSYNANIIANISICWGKTWCCCSDQSHFQW